MIGVYISVGAGLLVLFILSIIKITIWIKEKRTIFTIYFLSDNTIIKSYKYKKGEFVNFYIPEKNQYIFEGWFDNENFTSSPVEYYMVYNCDKSFYAKWKKIDY
jgi:uncharacterized repeat protein (TIGR02543 family)